MAAAAPAPGQTAAVALRMRIAMMRSTLIMPVHTLVLTLVGAGLWLGSCSTADAGRPRALRYKTDARDNPKEPTRLIDWVKGWGENQQQAKKDALKKAGVLVEGYLRTEAPALERMPSLAYIKRHLMKEPPTRLKDKDQTPFADKHLECWAWKVALSQSDWKDILHQDNDRRVQERMAWLGKILAGLLVLLTVVAGFFRLDDWTKGYYTTWLLAGGVGSLVLAGALLWLVS